MVVFDAIDPRTQLFEDNLAGGDSGHNFAYFNDHRSFSGSWLQEQNVVAIELFNNAGSTDAYLDFRLALNTTLVPAFGDSWRYRVGADAPVTARCDERAHRRLDARAQSDDWFKRSFDDGAMALGRAPFGFDDRPIDHIYGTQLDRPANADALFARRAFVVTPSDAARFSAFELKVLFDAKVRRRRLGRCSR